jgi:hypothetical protein
MLDEEGSFRAAAPRVATTRNVVMAGLCLGMIRTVALWTEPPEIPGPSKAQRAWKNIEDERLTYVEGHTLLLLRTKPHFRFRIRLLQPTFPRQ